MEFQTYSFTEMYFKVISENVVNAVNASMCLEMIFMDNSAICKVRLSRKFLHYMTPVSWTALFDGWVR